MARPVKSGVSLLIGAGIGVGLMYLLDPELGAKRRKTIQKQAGKKVSGVRDSASDFATKFAGTVADSVADHTPRIGSISSLVSPAVSALKSADEQLGEHLHSHIDDVQGKVNEAKSAGQSAVNSAVSSAKSKLHDARDHLLDQLSGHVDTLSDAAKAKYGKAFRDATLQMGRDEDHHVIGQTTCALGSLALGAGLVYFLDPDKGHDRRDNMASIVSTSVAEIGTFFRKIGTRLIHRGQEYAGQVSEQFDAVADKVSDLKQQYVDATSPQEEASPNDSYTSTH